MSFRELRSFTETMKSLGYPQVISMENFRVPNFELVADCLYWLVQRYYPGVDIPDDISTESERVKFLQLVAQVMLTKARMKLNIKRLYSADGVAVKELLKVASLLLKATEKAAQEDEDQGDSVDFSGVLKGFNPKEIKKNAAQIIKSGAALYDGLGMEAELNEERSRAVAGLVDTDFVERSIQEAIGQVEDGIRSLEQQLEDLESSETTLDAKIDKKKQELERNEKRLSTLQSVRPAYMDEYERLQQELNDLYGQYLDKFRNLEFLEHELEDYYQAEQRNMEKQEQRLKRMQRKLAEDEMRVLRGEQEVDESNLQSFGLDDLDDELDDVSDSSLDQRSKNAFSRTMRRPLSNRAKGARPNGAHHQMQGQVDGFDDDESIDEDNNSDGGEVSNAGSDRGARALQAAGYGRGMGAMADDDDF